VKVRTLRKLLFGSSISYGVFNERSCQISDGSDFWVVAKVKRSIKTTSR
jgi:hypothetical protein